MSAVVRFYVMQIRMHRLTIDQVPYEYREAVREALDDGAGT